MKSRFVVIILILAAVLTLAACGAGKNGPEVLPPLDSGRPADSVSTPGGSSEGGNPPLPPSISASDAGWQRELYTETVENGLKITVYSDGTLLLENGDVEENLKNRSVFSDYVANIKTVKFGNGVKRIGEKTFQNWDKLQNVIMGDDVLEIAYSAFSGCTVLADVSFGKNVQTIGEYAFTGCTWLKDAVLSDSVTSVGDYAFSKCTSLQNAYFGPNITYMGNMIFEGCKAFTYFKTASDIAPQAFEGNNALVTVHMEDSVKKIGERAFSGCGGLNFITWPAGLHEIGKYAFSGCTKLNVVTMTTADELTIGDGAFSACNNLKTVSLPEGLIKIGEKAFADCKELETLVLPVSLKEMDYGMLQNTLKLRIIGYRGTEQDWWKADFKKMSGWNISAGKAYPTKFKYQD